ncbi:MAG: hypothetical protein LUB61_00340 [Eggerthellaceae bacterium]|nr:hypothetical protein [Eggerthellaceae bacterium]
MSASLLMPSLSSINSKGINGCAFTEKKHGGSVFKLGLALFVGIIAQSGATQEAGGLVFLSSLDFSGMDMAVTVHTISETVAVSLSGVAMIAVMIVSVCRQCYLFSKSRRQLKPVYRPSS